MEQAVFDKIIHEVERRHLYVLLAEVSPSAACQRFLFEQRFEDVSNCALVYMMLLRNPALDAGLREEMLTATHPWGAQEPTIEEDGWIILGNESLWRCYPSDGQEESRLATAVNRYTRGWIIGDGQNERAATYLLTELCPKALDQYGVTGWELFFDMAKGWSGDLQELPGVVASLLSREAVVRVGCS